LTALIESSVHRLFLVRALLDNISLTCVLDTASVDSDLSEVLVDDSSSGNVNGNEGKLVSCKVGLDGQGVAGQSERDKHLRLVQGVENDKLFEGDMVEDLY
jgi:hypothetical protein